MNTRNRRVIVVADGDVDGPHLVAVTKVGGDEAVAPLLIAADGAAGKVLAAGLRPDIVIGDGDSLTADERSRLESMGVELRFAEPDKDESDTELCLVAALHTDASSISLLGALGGARHEHAIANVLLLADPRFDDVPLEIVADGMRLVRIGTATGPGEISIDGDAGDYISLFALGGAVDGILTEGLRFPLKEETLELGPARGLSNELLDTHATVTTRSGLLLLVYTARRKATEETVGD